MVFGGIGFPPRPKPATETRAPGRGAVPARAPGLSHGDMLQQLGDNQCWNKSAGRVVSHGESRDSLSPDIKFDGGKASLQEEPCVQISV